MSSAEPSITRASRAPLWKRAVRVIDPFTIIANIPGAVFQKEMWIAGRRTSTYVVRAGFMLLLLGFVSLVLLVSVGEFGGSGGPAAELQRYQSVAPTIMMTIGWCGFIGLSLVAMSRGSASVADERRMGSLSALMTTPLFAWQIVLGKLLSIMVELAILGLATAPLLLAVRTFGGLTGELVVRVTALTLLHALMAATVALFWSVNMKRGTGAFMAALLTVVFIEIGPPLLALMIDGALQRVGSSFRQALHASFEPEMLFFLTCSPPVLLFSMLEALGGGIPPGAAMSLAPNHMIYLGSWCAVLFVGASFMLRRRLALDAAGAAPAPPKKRRAKQEAISTAEAPAPGAKPRHSERDTAKPREVGDHPVLWREMEQSAFRKRWHGWAASGAVALLMLFLYSNPNVEHVWLHMAVSVVASLAITCVAAVSTTSGVSAEREGRTWETLLSTPLSAREIVLGKFLGALRRQWFVPLILALHIAFAGLLTGGLNWTVVFLLPPVLLSPLLLLTATGNLFSLILKKSASAATANFLLALGLYGAAPLSLGILSGIASGRNPGVSHAFKMAFGGVMSLNPVGMTVMVVGGAIEDSPMLSGGRYDFFDVGRMTLMEFALVVLVTSAVQIGVAHLVLTLTARRLCAESARHR